MLQAAAFEGLRWVLWLIYRTGCRPEEARELRWGDVFELERVIRLNKFKARDRRKDGVRVRLIPLPREVGPVFLAWRAARSPANSDRVFTNRVGGPWTCQALRLAVRRAARRAGLDSDDRERVTAYTLRHTAATELATRGMKDITLLADVLGHTSLTTTRRYIHRTVADLLGAIDGTGRGG